MADQIQISNDTTLGPLGAIGRYLITAGGAFVLGRGWIDSQTLQFVTGLVTVAAPLAYGAYKQWHNKHLLIATARAAPDAVAIVKGDAPPPTDAAALAAELKDRAEV